MRTLIPSLALSILFLSAGAFAGNSLKTTTISKATPANVTVVYKNSSIPLLPPALNACYFSLCVEV